MNLHQVWLGVAAAACGLFWAGAVQAQPPEGGFGPGGFRPGGFGAGGFGGSLELLQREDVRGELEVLDEQTAELKKLRDGLTGKLRELVTERDGATREQRFQKMRDLVAETQTQVDAILLPHQRKRLEQLSNQLRLRGGAAGTLLNERLAQELGLSEAQKEQLRTKAQRLEAELRQKMAELRKQAQDELLKELTPEQQAKWKEMVGEPFEFRPGESGVGRGGPGGGQPEPARGPAGRRGA